MIRGRAAEHPVKCSCGCGLRAIWAVKVGDNSKPTYCCQSSAEYINSATGEQGLSYSRVRL